ncbi:hypothetical protein GCM10010260_77270 [Streptomyces filipinensis]|uniref:Uncharacterized protein n=1 Tax=Streptomyces filipinensis TaxID=66887 RepID=A0A918IJC1_9ACTN|nr:hypothetical protein GCM10010260_77270 [Streptomyces filipinensis]
MLGAGFTRPTARRQGTPKDALTAVDRVRPSESPSSFSELTLMKRARLVPAVALLALSPLLLTACGSGDSSTSGSGNSGQRQGCQSPSGIPTGGAQGRRPSGASSGAPSGASTAKPAGAPSGLPTGMPSGAPDGQGQGGPGGGCGAGRRPGRGTGPAGRTGPAGLTDGPRALRPRGAARTGRAPLPARLRARLSPASDCGRC